MLQFIIGVFVGAIVSFFVFAICSVAGADEHTEDRRQEKQDDAWNNIDSSLCLLALSM